MASWTVWLWTRAPGRPRSRCPLCGQVLVPAGIPGHRWGPASRPGWACQGPAGCHPCRQGGGDLWSARPPEGLGGKSDWPQQLGLWLCPCPLPSCKETQPEPLATAALGSPPHPRPGAGGDKSGWHLPGVKEGCWLGQVDAARGGEREPARPPAPGAAVLLSPARLRRARQSWCGGGGRGGGGGGGEGACVCARPEPLRHLCIRMCSSLFQAPLTGWLRSSANARGPWRRLPSAPLPPPSRPHPSGFTSFAVI